MGAFDDLIPQNHGGNFDDLIPNKNIPNRLQKVIRQSRGFNPVGFLPSNKQEIADVAKVGLRQVLPDNPGLVGFGSSLVDKRPAPKLPSPETEYGKNLEGSIDAAQLVFGAGAIKDIAKSASRNIPKAFGKITKEGKNAQRIADSLYEGAQTARKNVGSDYEAILEKFGNDTRNVDSLTDSFQNAPKSLLDEIKNNPEIEKMTDNLGRVVIKPTVKNLKRLRDIVRGDVSARHWKPKMVDDTSKKAADFIYDEIGRIMREGNQEISDVMGRYKNVRSAGDEVENMLRTSKGFTKSRPVMSLYKEGADASRQQAFEALAKENPDLWKTMDDARRFGDTLRRNQAIKRAGSRFARYAAPLLAGGYVGRKYFGG